MAFHPQTVQRSTSAAQAVLPTRSLPEQELQPTESQEWILFSPHTRADSSTRETDTTNTQGLSRVSELGYFNSVGRSIQPDSVLEDEDAIEDAELDSLDDGLHAFREPVLYPTNTHQSSGPVLPAHDGLGSFQASSAPVLEQLWQHEQFNSKRKHEGAHRRASSIQRHLDTIEEFDAQAGEEKRMRIEKWRIEQSQALLEEVENETRRRIRRSSSQRSHADTSVEDILGTTPKQSDYLSSSTATWSAEVVQDSNEPFWRRITRKFIRDIIGIDEPLLSVILGESLPGEYTPRATSPVPEADTIPSASMSSNVPASTTWRDKLLQRIASELGVFPHQLNPHPGAFSTYTAPSFDYAGMPVSQIASQSTVPSSQIPIVTPGMTSDLGPDFSPTLKDASVVHAESWGLEEEPPLPSSEASLNLKKEREYWERELDAKMVFRFLRDRFTSTAPEPPPSTTQSQKDDSARRVAIIRQHHPLVSRGPRSSVRARKEVRPAVKRPSSSCASESLKGSKKASALRSGSSRNYWDIGGSAGGSSGIGVWGQV